VHRNIGPSATGVDAIAPRPVETDSPVGRIGLDFLRGFIVAKRDRDGALAQVQDHVVVVQGGKFEARLTS
jgi:hypothetical protein